MCYAVSSFLSEILHKKFYFLKNYELAARFRFITVPPCEYETFLTYRRIAKSTQFSSADWQHRIQD
jgi:hypothetical protein